jgi:hypothetical protein
MLLAKDACLLKEFLNLGDLGASDADMPSTAEMIDFFYTHQQRNVAERLLSMQVSDLTEEQRPVFDRITQSIEQSLRDHAAAQALSGCAPRKTIRARQILLHQRYRWHGKTYLLNMIIRQAVVGLRARVVACAATGIAASHLASGVTFHRLRQYVTGFCEYYWFVTYCSMDPFSKRWVHNCLGCWTNGNWFWKV